MTTCVPTLSITGWAKTPEDMAYFLFAHAYESEKNQTTIYGDNVTNIQWLNERYGKDIPEFCAQLREGLTKYLERHYDSVQVDITHNDNASNPGSLITVTISTIVYKDGRKYSFGHLVEKNGQVAKLLTMINGAYV